LKFVAKTIFGLEEILAQEITEQGGQNITKGNRAVEFEGDLEALYKINLWSRTALRVIKPFLSFSAHNETVFYKRLRRYDWTELIGLDQTFMINSTVNSDVYNHSQYIALKTKDAIVDSFRERYNGLRPSIDLEIPDVVLDVHCRGIEFTISLDSSGRSLHRRGYRQSMRKAPLNEALAAGMIMLSGWDKKTPLLDPMCGSGTILTEAYMIAQGIAPRATWERFAFMNWKGYDDALWKRILLGTLNAKKELETEIIGYDIDHEQIQETRELLTELGFEDIRLKRMDFTKSEKPLDEGTIITNPPYGIRLGEEEDVTELYKAVGDTFKQQYAGWTAWILSGNKQAIKRVGLRTSRKMTLFNGQIECKFHKYEMYKGSVKRD
jgi:putative N6-adenine-specific DNA methylase